MCIDRFKRARAAAAILCAAMLICITGCGGTRNHTDDRSDPAAPAATARSEAPRETQTAVESQTAEPQSTEAPTEPAPTQDPAAAVTLDDIFERYGAVGAQVAVIRDGRVSEVYSYGYANRNEGMRVTEDTKYRCASLSKLVADMVFMRLTETGVMEETGDIGDYLGYRVRSPYHPDTPITPRMLMTHTSSVIDSETFLDSRLNGSYMPLKTLLSYESSYTHATPGSSYRYSNFGVAVLAAACEKVMNADFGTLTKQYLTGPLGIDAAYTASALEDSSLLGTLYGSGGYSVSQQMALSFCDEPGQTHHLAQGNFTVSAKDYAKIICVLLCSGKSGEKQIISQKSVDAILENRARDRDRGIGYGVEIIDTLFAGENWYVHTGSNFGMYSAYAFSPEKRCGAVVLTSGAEGGKDAATEIYNVCLDAIRAVLDE